VIAAAGLALACLALVLLGLARAVRWLLDRRRLAARGRRPDVDRAATGPARR